MKRSNYEKGLLFAQKVCDLINLYFNLTTNRRAIPTPRSGAINGLKGDLMRLPKPIHKWCVECKDEEKVSVQLIDWWNQAKDAAERMAMEPVLAIDMPNTNEILVVQTLKNAIKGTLIRNNGK